MPLDHHPPLSIDGNLFADPDSDVEVVTPQPRDWRPLKLGTTARPGRGFVVRVDAAGSPTHTAAIRFTRTRGGLAALPARIRSCPSRADVSAQRLLRRVIARPYGALALIVLIGVLLLATSWLALSLRYASAHRSAARMHAPANHVFLPGSTPRRTLAFLGVPTAKDASRR